MIFYYLQFGVHRIFKKLMESDAVITCSALLVDCYRVTIVNELIVLNHEGGIPVKQTIRVR